MHLYMPCTYVTLICQPDPPIFRRSPCFQRLQEAEVQTDDEVSEVGATLPEARPEEKGAGRNPMGPMISWGLVENHRKTMGKPWGNAGFVGVSWDFYR